MTSMLWDDQAISPADWIGILRFEIQNDDRFFKNAGYEDGSRLSNENCIIWLTKQSLKLIGAKGEVNKLSSYVSRFSQLSNNHHPSDSKLTFVEKNIVDAIKESVSFRSCVCFFEDLAYRSIKFFIPQGDIDWGKGEPPLGLYQATRYSLVLSGRMIRSAFLFYKNDAPSERLQSYDRYKDSSVLRFKELRKIKNDTGGEYQIISGGLVFWSHQCFIGIGASYVTSSGKPEHELKLSDIKHAQTAYYIFDDDGDADVVRGLKASILPKDGDPVAPTIELRRVSQSKKIDWRSIEECELIDFGVYEPKDPEKPELGEFVKRLEPHASTEYFMQRVKPFNLQN